MSEGDSRSAAGRSGTSGDGRPPHPLPTAAPWERWQRPVRDAAGPQRWSATPPAQTQDYPEDLDDAATGSHTGGDLTVADLIAKMGASTVVGPARHHGPAATEVPGPQVLNGPADDSVTQVFQSLAAYAGPPVDLNFDRDAGRVPPARIDRTVPAPAPAPRSHRSILMAGRTLAALIAVLSLALTGGAWQWSASKNNQLNTVSALDPDSRDIVDPHGQYGDENFLIVGVDSRAGENSGMGAGDTEDAGGARSDTVMLVNIPADRNRVVAVSFPRDLAITPMRCEAWNPDTGEYGALYDETVGGYGYDTVYTETKLNSAFAFGGPKCLVKVIQKLSGLSINRFMAIDFAGFAKMVDALGGVEVCSTTALEDYELGTVLTQAGPQLVNGQTALNYVRARQVTTEINGDYGRIKRQQLFLSSLLRSLISRDTFFSLKKLNNVVNMFIGDSYVDNVTTKDLVDLGQSVQGVSAGHITFVTVPTGETDENGDEPPRRADMRALFDAIINDDPLPGEGADIADSADSPMLALAAPPGGAAAEGTDEQVQAVTTAPQDITVQVSNSTGESGLAATASDELEQHGFNVMTPDDYPTSLTATTVFFSPGNEQAAATVAAAFPRSEIQRAVGKGQLVQVVLGPDFQSVTAPPPTGSSVSVPLNHTKATPPTELPEDLTVTNAGDTTCE